MGGLLAYLLDLLHKDIFFCASGVFVPWLLTSSVAYLVLIHLVGVPFGRL
jgi:hypothetical protein